MKRHAIVMAVSASLLALGPAAPVPANASAGRPAPTGFGFTASREHPVAGRIFRAVVVVDHDPSNVTIRRVRCDAQVGTERLRGRQRPYFVPPYTGAADVVCSWRIPAGAAGERLRLWHYGFGRRVGVFDASGLVAASRSFTWLVKS